VFEHFETLRTVGGLLFLGGELKHDPRGKIFTRGRGSESGGGGFNLEAPCNSNTAVSHTSLVVSILNTIHRSRLTLPACTLTCLTAYLTACLTAYLIAYLTAWLWILIFWLLMLFDLTSVITLVPVTSVLLVL